MGAYRLVDCSGSLPDIYTDSVYTPTIDTYEGKIIYTQQYPNTCWEVIKDVAPTPETLGILFSFDLCPDCLDTLDTQCGCPTGYTYNTITQLCESSTSVCPEGYTYNASSGLCEAPSEPCELDLVIAIDRSSSISSTEMPLYKSFIREIIDAIQDDGNTNRITTDQVRVGIVYWGTSSPLTGVETAGNSNLDLQIGSSTTWQSGLASGSLKLKISSMAPVGPGTSYNGQGTNYFAGLRAAYQVITGTNSRPLANKRILWITDGWPNTSNPPVTINGITQPNHLSDNACTIPSITGVNSNPAPLNICHGPSDVAGGSNTSPYSIAKKLVYEQAMDLAQDIKNGTGSDTTVPVEITAIIVGNQDERATTKAALVGTNPTGIGANDYCYFNVNTWAISQGLITASNCKFWDASYPIDSPPSSGNWLRFPSNNAAGTPDYFETEFQYDPTIINGIVTSLICTDTVTPASCNEPCILNETTGECECASGDIYVNCCYDLINCKDGSIYATVNTNDLTYDFLAQYVGSIITFEGLEICLWVQTSDNCSNSTPIQNLANIQQYETCEECQSINECYLLTNCNNGEVTLLSHQDLSAVAGKVVELAAYPGLCWTVLKTFNCPGPFTTVAITNTYEDCECCYQYQCV